MPDNIVFNAIPIDLRTPGAFIGVDNSRASTGLPSQPRKMLVMGQRLAAGTVQAGIPTHIFDPVQAVQYFGQGSQLAMMIAATKAANPSTDMWAIALDDLAAGVAASGTLTFTGAPTAGGTLNLYVHGVKIPVGISAGDAVATIATNVAAAINAKTSLLVTAAAALGVVTITARHKGLCGNSIDLRLNYNDGDATPAGVAVAIVAMAGGTGNPDVNTALTALGSDQYYTMISPWTDAANMAAVESFLQTRWGPMSQLTGHVFAAYSATLANLTTYGTTRNSPHSSVMGIYDAPQLPEMWASVVGAIAELYGAIDPAQPFQTLLLPGILPPLIRSQFTRDQRDVLLHDGISTFTVDQGGNVSIERLITTYQTNSAGIPDVSYLDLNTKWTVDYIRYATRARILLKFPRFKLADDGTNFAPGQPIATPSILRGELITLFRELEEAGLVENFDQFKQDLLVVRSTADVNRVNAVIPPNIINQFRVFAASVQFIL